MDFRFKAFLPLFVYAVCAGAGPVASGSYDSPLPGMPPVLNPADIYSEDHAGKLSPVVRNFPPRIYVPNSGSNTVDVIDPETYKIVGHFDVGKQPQHVVPSWDLKSLWVLNDLGDSLTRIDPATGKKGETIPVQDPVQHVLHARTASTPSWWPKRRSVWISTIPRP